MQINLDNLQPIIIFISGIAITFIIARQNVSKLNLETALKPQT
jgi:hypothetical protein